MQGSLLMKPISKNELTLQLMALKVEEQRIQQRLRDAVAMCRQPNFLGVPAMTWQEIADALGVTRQAVAQRFADRALRLASRPAPTTTRSGAKGRQA